MLLEVDNGATATKREERKGGAKKREESFLKSLRDNKSTLGYPVNTSNTNRF